MSKQKDPCKWEKALVSLTPGGSEFCGDPEYCVKYIKEFQKVQHEFIIKLIKEIKELVQEYSKYVNLINYSHNAK